MTQNELILRHLHDIGEITAMDAMKEYGIMRLASRIRDIKDSGVAIRTTHRTSKNRYGEPTTFAVYSLAERSAQ